MYSNFRFSVVCIHSVGVPYLLVQDTIDIVEPSTHVDHVDDLSWLEMQFLNS